MSALPRIPFNKPPLSLPDQLALLVSRGLTVNDPADATHYLTHIGYYRLSGYALPFQIGGAGPGRHNFKPGVTFDQILDLYVFDRKLRLLVMDAVERIEISIRAAMSNTIAARHGAHWYLKPQLFSATFNHARFLEDIKQQIGHASTNNRRRDIYIEHYYQTYSTPDMPPSWMVFESLNFGTISFAYMNLAPPEFVSVCGSYGLPHQVLISWLHSLNYIRNICAHHSRLWNRECRIKPVIARAFKVELTPNERVYAQLVVMQIMLAKIAPGNHWAQKLRDLLVEHPGALGFCGEAAVLFGPAASAFSPVVLLVFAGAVAVGLLLFVLGLRGARGPRNAVMALSSVATPAGLAAAIWWLGGPEAFHNIWVRLIGLRHRCPAQ